MLSVQSDKISAATKRASSGVDYDLWCLPVWGLQESSKDYLIIDHYKLEADVEDPLSL